MILYTDLLEGLSYLDLIDLYGQLSEFSPDHELIKWVEQEIQLRDEMMRHHLNAMHAYGEQCRYDLEDLL